MSFLNTLKSIVTSDISKTIATTAAGAVNPILGMVVHEIVNQEDVGGSGQVKKEAVLTAVMNSARKQGINLNIEQLDKLVDNLVEALNKTK